MTGISAPKLMLVVTIFMALLVACAPATAPEPPAASPTPLRVVTFPYLSFAPIYIAHDEGFFTQQGLDVELVRMQRNSDSLPALISGDIDVDSIFTVGVLNAVTRGENVRVVANKGVLAPDQCPADGFMVRSCPKTKSRFQGIISSHKNEEERNVERNSSMSMFDLYPTGRTPGQTFALSDELVSEPVR